MAKWLLSLFVVIVGLCISCRSGKQTRGVILDNTAIDNVQADSLKLDSMQVARNIIRIRDSTKAIYDSLRLKTLNTAIAEIAEYNRVDYAHIEGGGASNQWIRFGLLKTIASDSALVALTDHRNTTVRSYAFQALTERHSDKTFNILLNHLHDTARVTSASDRYIFTERTGDYLIGIAKLNSKEQAILDSIMIYDETISLAHKYEVLESFKPQETYYDRIRELVQKERNASALIALARFKKQSDKSLIASFFENVDTQNEALQAVNEFADPYFYPYLKNVFKQDWKEEFYLYVKWRTCFQALAQYPTAETVEMFKRIFLIKDKFEYESLCKYLLIAIRKHPHQMYEPLEKKIKLSKKQMQEVNEYLINGY